MDLEKYKKEYSDKKFITFGLTIKQKLNDKKIWKKDLILPKAWQQTTLENKTITKSNNALGMLTGKINNIFVIDVDNVDEWNELLKITGQKEPLTVRATSGNGGFHLYFQYTDNLKDITSKDHAITLNGKKLAIDVKTNGGFIICPPSEYYHEGKKENVKYTWDYSIIMYAMLPVPKWLENVLNGKYKDIMEMTTSNEKIHMLNTKILNTPNEEIIEFKQSDFTDNDIKKLCSLLSVDRLNNYKSWIDVGMCLKNLSTKYLKYWIDISKKSPKFNEKECEDKWKSFKVTKDGFGIGSLIKWAKDDNCDKCEAFLKDRNIKSFIENNKNKFPDNDLEISKIISNNDYHYISLNDKYCPIVEKNHKKHSVFLELTPYELVLKCNKCIGKYPCDHIRPTEKDIRQLFNIKIDKVTIKNYYTGNENIDDIEIDNIKITEDDVFDKLLIKSLNGTHFDIAEVLFYLTKNNFVYADKDTDSDTKIWYEFYDHKWNESIRLRNLISKMLPDKYEAIINEYKKKLTGDEEDNINKMKIKKIKNIIKTLKTSNVKNNIVTELEELAQVELGCNFYDKLDSKMHLFGFNNGVYDFKNMEFRNGKPDDYISITCGYDYTAEHTNNYDKLNEFLNDIQPDKIQLDYLLTYISTCLGGRNSEELFTILTGTGRNGKSKLISLIKKVFGNYAGSVTSKLFTRPRPDANSPDPGLLFLSKKRITFASEPEKTDNLNSGFIKFITGNDSALLRKCHGNNMHDFKANFITFLICNDIPNIDEMDNAFYKRLRCIPFETVFCEEPKKDNERKINKDIESELDNYAQDMMLILIEKYKIYINNNRKLVPTAKITDFTNAYKDDVDIYHSFLTECTTDAESDIHMSDLYNSFKFWFRNNYPNEKPPNVKPFNNGIRKHKTIDKSVRVSSRISTGIKNIRLFKKYKM